MARQRYINTDFWRDEYIENLDPLERYLFLYYLTNPICNIAGVYKIGIKRIAFETGIEKDMITKMTNRFTKEGKILFKDGWIVVRNFIKHQAVNPNIQKGIDIILKTAPKFAIDWLNKPFKSLSKPSNYVNVNDNVNNNDNVNTNKKLPDKSGGTEIISLYTFLLKENNIIYIPAEYEYSTFHSGYKKYIKAGVPHDDIVKAMNVWFNKKIGHWCGYVLKNFWPDISKIQAGSKKDNKIKNIVNKYKGQ